MKGLGLALWFVMATALIYYATMESKVLKPSYRSPDAVVGRTVPYTLKGSEVYVTQHEARELSGSLAVALVGFVTFLVLGVIDALMRRKKQ